MDKIIVIALDPADDHRYAVLALLCSLDMMTIELPRSNGKRSLQDRVSAFSEDLKAAFQKAEFEEKRARREPPRWSRKAAWGKPWR